MKRNVFKKSLLFVIGFVLMFCVFMPSVSAQSDIENVISQLESIDTLSQMQNKRNSYTASGHYDINTTNASVISKHEKARAGYETYVADMFEKRKAAQKAYDELSAEQKAQIPTELVAKLSNELPTVFKTATYSLTPRDDEYAFETVNGGAGYGYEVSNHMISGEIPQTFILVDVSDGATSWTPNGRYVYGKSNYDLTYCCDIETPIKYGIHYKRVNLEDSGYFNESESRHIRAVLENSYPFVSMDEMKASLRKGGMDAAFVDSLTRADMIAAVQMSVWTYANIFDGAAGGLEYFASIDVPKNIGLYFTALHDYTNEVWDWLPGKRQRSFDARAQYRVNTLAEYLCGLSAVDAKKEQVVITKAEIVDTELKSLNDDIYNITLSVMLNGGGDKRDDIEISAVAYTENEDGTAKVTGSAVKKAVREKDHYRISVAARDGDTIKVEINGKQYLSKGVYFYEPEGGREASQSLVGISEGYTNVKAESKTVFNAPDYNITVPESISIIKGEKKNLGVTVQPNDGIVMPKYTSSDESVVTVDLNGNIKGIKPGEAEITVEFNNGEVRIIPVVIAEIPRPPKRHDVCFGKTDGIGWYEVSVNGGDFFPQGPNSTLQVTEGSVLVVRVQDMWIDDEFDFYVNGVKVPMDPANTITVVVDGYMLIGALSMDVEVPDAKESFNLFEIIANAFREFFAWIASLFD